MPTSEKQGYKYTEEFGYIPEDWEVKTLGDIGNVSMCKRIMKHETLKIGDVPFYKIGTFGNIPDAYISQEKFLEYKNKYPYPQKGDILISAAGTIGRTVIYDGKPAYFQDSNIVWLKHNETKVLNKYLFYYYKTNPWYTTTGGTIARLYNDNITMASIFIPPMPEQEKIAEVLGDIDGLIEKTQQLIDKKKDLKTATMQKLLAPKDDWKTTTLGELNINMFKGNGLSKSQLLETGKFKCIHYGELFTYYKEQIRKIRYRTDIMTIPSKENDVLMPTSDVTPTGLAKASCIKEDNVVLGGDILIIRCSNIIDGVFLSYIIRMDKTQILQLVSGTTVYHIYPNDMKKFKLSFPKYIEEQRKIVTILSDMDSEIEALEKELSKYQDLKTGMMQDLLTGKVRLIDKKVKFNSKVVDITSTKTQNKANDEFKDAILISMLAYKFGSEQYPLGAFRRQKLSYLFKRYNNIPIDEYMKKAMGPYNPKMKYQGAEGIALRNKYVKSVDRGLVATNSISKAEEYYNRYYQQESLSWLVKNFHYESNNNLEVLTTVDFAIVDLRNQDKEITLKNIKTYIASDKEWKPKLDKDFFTDEAIIKAMETSKALLNSY